MNKTKRLTIRVFDRRKGVELSSVSLKQAAWRISMASAAIRQGLKQPEIEDRLAAGCAFETPQYRFQLDMRADSRKEQPQ